MRKRGLQGSAVTMTFNDSLLVSIGKSGELKVENITNVLVTVSVVPFDSCLYYH